MSDIFIALLMVVNAIICFSNARAAGKVWAEAKAVGGWIQIVVWCAAIQAALGFSYVYLYILMSIGFEFDLISYRTMGFVYSLEYFFIILPIVGTGIIMTVESWINAARERSLLNLGVAGWNTFATAYNMYHVINAFGPAFDNVKEFFNGITSDDSDDDSFDAIVLVAVALAAGVVTTMIIVQRYAGTLPISEAVRQHAGELAGA